MSEIRDAQQRVHEIFSAEFASGASGGDPARRWLEANDLDEEEWKAVLDEVREVVERNVATNGLTGALRGGLSYAACIGYTLGRERGVWGE